jgi:hypothetical protein
MSSRNRLNWDVHMVSMYQALFINTAALWCIFADPARAMQNEPDSWAERLWGYNGAAGMCQAFATGYFLWDVVVSSVHLDVMGASSLVHAIAALAVTCIGFVSVTQVKTLLFTHPNPGDSVPSRTTTVSTLCCMSYQRHF